MTKLEKAVRAVLAVHDKRQIVEYMDEMDALREALTEQPAQDQGQSCYCPECERLSKELDAIKAQQQEPVAWITKNGKGWLRWHKPEDSEKNKDSIPLYTSPPASKPWQGLTLEDKQRVIDSNFGGSRADCMDEAEKILRERNA